MTVSRIAPAIGWLTRYRANGVLFEEGKTGGGGLCVYISDA